MRTLPHATFLLKQQANYCKRVHADRRRTALARHHGRERWHRSRTRLTDAQRNWFLPHSVAQDGVDEQRLPARRSIGSLQEMFDLARLQPDFRSSNWSATTPAHAVHGHPFGLTLSAEDRTALVKFLKTL